MGTRFKEQKERQKIIVITILLAIACFFTYYFHVVHQTGTVFTHFFYIPIILASLWWKRKGLVVAIFLAALLIISRIFFGLDVGTANDFIRALFFIVISLGVSMLSERITKAEDMLWETHGYLESLFNYANAPIIVWDKTFRITRFNSAFEHFTGYTANELIGQELYMFFPEATRDESLGKIECTSKDENWKSVEIPILRKDGGIRTALWNSANIYAEDDTTLLATIAQGTDITKRKQMEEALLASENKYKTLLENLPQKIFHKDKNSVYVSCNNNYAVDLEIKPDEIIGKTDYDFYPRELAEKYRADDKKIMESGKTEDIEEKYIQDGREVIVQTVKTPIKDEKGNIAGTLGIFWDITERKKTEEEKTRIGARLQDKVTELSIMNEISEVLLSTRELDEILHMILIGATAYQALGFNRAFLFLINEEETMLEGEVATGSLRPEEAYKIWERLAQESHTLKELLKSRHGELSKEDEPINNLVKQMKIPLKEKESIFPQAMYEKKSFNIVDGIENPLIDRDLIRLLGTDAFALVPLISRGKSLGMLLADNFINRKPIDDEDVERLRAFANHASLAIENSHLYKSLEEKVEELSHAYNELRENRDKLLRYERLSAVGEVSAKITHEIRNPLVSIGGFARRILKKDRDGELNRNYLKIIVEEIDRLENILTDTLYFAKPSVPKCDNVDLNRVIKSTIAVLGLEIEKNNISVEEHLAPNLPMLWLDEKQIRRVLINLIKNAIQAMLDGGTITIYTINENQWVRVEIADTGVGISDEDMDKMFDAFYTSKTTGSGLGLTVSAQIINNHGGTIEIQKRKPKGIIFIIKLPAKSSS